MGAAVRSAARSVSFWFDDLVERGLDDLEPRPGLSGDRHVDVCIVGAGFTGLWAALAVRALEPGARILVVEREIAGFGASGRNGGWCSALFPVSDDDLERRHGRRAAAAMRQALVDTVHEVERSAAELGIDCDFVRAGTRSLIRGPVAEAAAEAEIAGARRLGVAHPVREDTEPLGPSLRDPDCASLHPGKLVRGLARAAEDRGVEIAERTRVVDWGAHEVAPTGAPSGATGSSWRPRPGVRPCPPRGGGSGRCTP